MTNRFASDKIAELVMGLKKLISKNKLKKFLTKANKFDKINELLIERTAKKFEKNFEKYIKKVLDKRKVL